MAAIRRPRRYRINQIRALQAQDKSLKEIAEIIGLSYKTVVSYNSDPGGQRQRGYLRNMNNQCASCGKPCSHRSRICRACYIAQMHKNKRWTKEEIIRALQEFGQRWGRPPVFTDTVAYPDQLPNGKLIWAECGSWANAVEAAGFPRPHRGGYRGKKKQPVS